MKRDSVTKMSKKDVQKKIRAILMRMIGLMGIKAPSKKLKKEVKETSKVVGERVLSDLEKAGKSKKSDTKRAKEKIKKSDVQ